MRKGENKAERKLEKNTPDSMSHKEQPGKEGEQGARLYPLRPAPSRRGEVGGSEHTSGTLCSGGILSSRSERDKATLKTLWVYYGIAQARQHIPVVGGREAGSAQAGQEETLWRGTEPEFNV